MHRGGTIALTLRFGMQSTAAERFDIGIFVGDDGGSPIGGASCSFASLIPLEPPFDPLSGSGPYRNLDGDACGDAAAADGLIFRDVNLTSVLCRDDDGDGRLDIDYMLTWSANRSQDVCLDPTDPANFFPKQSARCQLQIDADLDIPVEPPPSIALTKTASPERLPAPGGEVTYTVVVQNTSSPTDPVTMDLAGLVDDLYGDLNGQGTCVLPQSLATGHQYTCEFTQTVTGASGDTVTDVVTASGSDDEGTPVSATDDATVTLGPPVPTIEVNKFAAPASVEEPGGPVLYAVIVHNTSQLAAVEIDTLVDDLYGDLFTKTLCVQTRALLLPGESLGCVFVEQVAGEPGDVIRDTVTATGSTPDGQSVSGLDSAEVLISDVPSKLEVRKFAVPSSLAEPGGNVLFPVRVQNVSATDAVTITQLSDNVYGDLNGRGTCAVPHTLQPGESYTCAFLGAVSGNAGDIATDTVTAVGVDDDASAVAAQGAADVTIIDVPGSMAVIKTATPTRLPTSGGTVTFTATVQNLSDVDTLTVERLTDRVEGGLLIDLDGQGDCSVPQTVAPGDSYRCSFSEFVSGNEGDTRTDTVTAEGVDDEGAVLTASDDAIVTFSDNPAVQIAVTKVAIPQQIAEPGGEVTYLILVDNLSTQTVVLKSLVDDLYGDLNGRGTCTVGALIVPGERFRCAFRETVNGSAGDPPVKDTVIAVATVSDAAGPEVSDQDSAEVTFVDLPSAIHVEKTVTPVFLPVPGGTVTFTVDLRNVSSDAVTIDSLTDDVHGDLDGRGDCSLPQTLGPALAPDDSYRCSFTAEVTGLDGDQETDTVTAAGTGDDGQPVSARDSALVQIIAASTSLAVAKTAEPTALPAPGGEVTFTVTVANILSEDSLTLTRLEDDIYGDLDGQGNCVLPQSLTPLPPGNLYTCSFTGAVTGSVGDVQTDTVTAIATSDRDGEPFSAEARASVTIVGQAVGIPHCRRGDRCWR